MARFYCQKNKKTSQEKVFRNSCSYKKLLHSNGKYYTTMKGNTLRKDFEKCPYTVLCIPMALKIIDKHISLFHITAL